MRTYWVVVQSVDDSPGYQGFRLERYPFDAPILALECVKQLLQKGYVHITIEVEEE